MRKAIIFSAILCIIILTYLFYHSCKRDTLVIKPSNRIGIPDSSWVYGSIHLDQIKKEIAWSTLLSGDVSFLFHSDTLSNTLIKVLKSPTTYSIIEQNNIIFFSEAKESHLYSGLILKLKNPDALKKAFVSDSIKNRNSYLYTFRSLEGIWMYNTNNLIFIATQEQDSLYAQHILDGKQTTIIEPIPTDSVLVQATIQTAYLPNSMKHVLLDSARIEIALKQNGDALQLDWNYVGKLANCLSQSNFTLPHTETGFFLHVTQTEAGLNSLRTAMDTTQTIYKKNKRVIDVFKTSLIDNPLRIEFNGWKKIKTSYYVSKMNDEFEMVMHKVDTTFIEPLFECNLQQKNSSETNTFLAFLKKEGLITKQSSNTYNLVLGNFDSELRVEKNHSITLENTHKRIRMLPLATQAKAAALYVELKPAYVQGLFEGSIQKEIPARVIQQLKKIESIRIEVNRNDSHLNGSTTIRFNEKKHPIISLMGLLKE
ncbi:hypothetical protein [uncultured Cytophaga sp.]|uniref:hypothetical protein n=1 Tax=uncultured Cytophaga sp. TaxID=160238 RepID=UPI00262AFB3E|nr:hypothetical protein [uncultured Cytophaga sp.]